MELVIVLGYSWIFLIFVALLPFLSLFFFMRSSHSSLLSFRLLQRSFGCKWTVTFKTFQPNPIALSRSWPACPSIDTVSRLLFATRQPLIAASLFLFRSSVVQLYVTKRDTASCSSVSVPQNFRSLHAPNGFVRTVRLSVCPVLSADRFP